MQAKRLYLFFASFTSMAGSNESIAKKSIWERASGKSWKMESSMLNTKSQCLNAFKRNKNMDIQAPYYRQVALLMQVLPYVAVEREFALKGGTAINLFIRDFPRLSVDIDLARVPQESRAIALPHIRDALARIAANLQQQAGMSAVLQANRSDEMRVIVTTDSAQIKIEVSPVAREHYIHHRSEKWWGR
nr:Nucleotidyl transferase of uncharacterised function (DUF1814) [Klebsiella pneumoniae]